MRRFAPTWIAAIVVLVAAGRAFEMPHYQVPTVTSAIEVCEVASPVASIEGSKAEIEFQPVVTRNTLLAIEGRVVDSNDAVDNWSGSVAVTLLDGRTGELVRTVVDTDELDDTTGWQWWYQRH